MTPSDLNEACHYLAKFGGRGEILAGGTDLMVAINRRTFIPEVIIYIGNLDLEYITEKDDFLVIGSMTTHDSIVRSKIINEKIPLLSECVKTIGSPAIRNMGTIGGNLVNASPASDSAVALLALQARLRLTSNNGSRIIDLDTFFMGPGQTILNSDELVKEIIIPIPVSGAKWGWRKMGLRKAEICSVVSVAVMLEKEVDICGGLRICLGAVAPIPMVIKEVEILAKDKRLSQTLIMNWLIWYHKKLVQLRTFGPLPGTGERCRRHWCVSCSVIGSSERNLWNADNSSEGKW